MKKRIISLMLVIVMMAMALVSCGFSYENDDLSGYASFDKDAFLAELLALEIEEGSFSGDEDTRNAKVLDNIYSTLATLVDADEKITAGAIGERDLLYYCYYATAVFGEGDAAKTVVLFASKMNESSPTKLQLGTTGAEGVNKAIQDAVKNISDIADYVYTTDSNAASVLAYGDKVYVSFDYQYTATEDDGTEVVKKGSVAYQEMTLTENTSKFIDAFIGKNVGAKLDEFKTDDEARAAEVTYTNATVHWVVKGGEAISFKDTTYTDTKTEKDTDGESRDLKDKELTYYVYPVYVQKVPTMTAENLFDAIGSSISSVELDCFTKEEYKYTDAEGKEQTYKDLITKLAELYKTVENEEKAVADAEKAQTEKQTAYDKAKKALDDAGENATDAQKNAESSAKTALDKANETLDKEKGELKAAEEAVDAQVAIIFGLAEGMADTVVNDYKAYVYDKLEASYDNENKMSLAKVIWEKLQAKATVTALPEDMVNKAYNRLIENYEYSFNEEMYDSNNKTSNYAQYNGSFESYLIATTKADDYAGALAEVRADAEEYVKPILQLYTAVRAIGEDIIVTDAEFNAYKKDNETLVYYAEYYGYGENSLRYAYQFDCLMNYLLETEEVEEGATDKDGADFKYKRVDFTFKSDESAEDADDDQ